MSYKSKFNKNKKISSIVPLEYSFDSLYLKPQASLNVVQGFQFDYESATSGTFSFNLPKSWKIYQNDKRVLAYTEDNGYVMQNDLATFSGQLTKVSNIIFADGEGNRLNVTISKNDNSVSNINSNVEDLDVEVEKIENIAKVIQDDISSTNTNTNTKTGY